MAGPDGVLVLAWIAAVLGPILSILMIRLLLRDGRIFLARTVIGLSVIGWGLGVWAFLIEPATLTVRHVTIESSGWSGPPIRIGVISDTHVAAPHVDVTRVADIVDRMNRQQPDLVVLLGDYTGGHDPSDLRAPPERSEILQGVLAFRNLKAPLGVYGVLGNHDSWFDEAEIANALTQANVRVVENRSLRVESDGGPFWVAGLADLVSRRMEPSMSAALNGVPDSDPVILLTHWPDPFAEAPSRVALTLAGHTHCGQVNLPLIGRPVLPSPASHRWPCGAYDEDGRKLFVTGGVGVSILPVRFRAPPEIVILTLKAAS
ncbi:metallophosphoesterase [Brevundimonas staleyi]|uniref:Metallophosphoesterase n=1 Tax=Brevundimonas staleyi TaxID=74326 RepID=A0ABW0FQX3_9CAUL